VLPLSKEEKIVMAKEGPTPSKKWSEERKKAHSERMKRSLRPRWERRIPHGL
jgi:hypothetical protein